MLYKLQNDSFIFSGLKTHAQLMEAASLLRDENGKIRSFDSFAHEFNKINENYNQNYLEAEYQFAVSSSQQAANWANLDDSDRYYLQYRTAFDDRVRESHAAMHNTTLPKDDPFWSSYYPPNGWRCRCTVVEVRRTRYEMSDSEKAMKSGELATTQINKEGKNKLEIFRFNPGAENKVFPPEHPYNKVKGAVEVKKELENKDSKFSDVVQSLKDKNISYLEVKQLSKKLTDNEIIEKIGGGDLTSGSCSSLSFAYAGNKHGLDVNDFRGGDSRSFFGSGRNVETISNKVGGITERDENDITAVRKLIKNIEKNKEYILVTGQHSAVIRMSKDDKLEFLELQSPTSNGFKPLNSDILKRRFGCKKSHTTYGMKYKAPSTLIDIDNLNVDGYSEMLGYINTATDEQKKGSKGRTR
ncbi:phage head morphogenesis protein [Chryseobacterium koreense]|nr:phage minor head protein [Chryseobacterium koreense]MBB5334728.1 SPP1 gp7 family putative phage head morphogenesis protein [Chryseobacterium koreense]